MFRICLTYKVVTPDIKRKQNNFFRIFEILASSRDFNKLVIKVKMQAKTLFFFMKIQYDFFNFFLERLGRMYENKKIFFIFIFL